MSPACHVCPLCRGSHLNLKANKSAPSFRALVRRPSATRGPVGPMRRWLTLGWLAFASGLRLPADNGGVTQIGANVKSDPSTQDGTVEVQLASGWAARQRALSSYDCCICPSPPPPPPSPSPPPPPPPPSPPPSPPLSEFT
eukprot:scaffold83360_cov45-Phaeocystis_antarctica.AAC.1